MTTIPSGHDRPGDSRRFNSQEYVVEWQEHRRFPRIHDDIMDGAVVALPLPAEAGRVLDLCGSTGLLGRRIASIGFKVAWQDGDADAVQRGIAAGIIESDHLWFGILGLSTWHEFLTWLEDQDVRTVVARRCLCVLSDDIPIDTMRDGFAAAGVRAVLLEGQRQDRRAVQPYGSADQQADGLGPLYTRKHASELGRDVRYLVH